MYLSGLVLGGGEEVGPVGGHLHVGNQHVRLVDLFTVNKFTSLICR